MACNAGPDIIEDGLVFCVDAANINSYPKTGTTLTDLKGGNSGTLTNMADNFDTANRGSLTFDGSNETVAFGSAGAAIVNGLSELTLEMCFKASSTNSDRGLIFGSNTSNSKDDGFGLRFDAGGFLGGGTRVIKAAFGANNNGTNTTAIESSSLIQSTDWVCISVVCDLATSIDLYKDSLLDTHTGKSISTSVTSVSNCDNLVIGRGCKSGLWSGNIQSVRIYNRILTSNEIRQNYEATVGRFT